jgi:hypothetical protein
VTVQDYDPPIVATTDEPDWGAMTEKLVANFPAFAAGDVIAEIVQARDAAVYVGTTDDDLAEVVEFMATYALRVRAGEVTPSSRLDPETHASPRARNSEGSIT